MSVPQNPPTVDLNADLGEGFPHDQELLDLVTSASVACGAHAGDRETMLRTMSEAHARGVVVGAHPGFADRASFGRREQPASARDVERLIRSQVGFLTGLTQEIAESTASESYPGQRPTRHQAGPERRPAARQAVIVRYVKPHGALYNQAQRDAEVAAGVIAAMIRLSVSVLGQPGSVLETFARDAGVRFITEGFPDRRYRSDGRLASRSEPGAILTDRFEIETQVLRLVELGVESLCIHGDDPRAVQNAVTVRSVLESQGIVIQSFA